MRSDLIDLALEIRGETDRAVAVVNLKGERVWLPRSQIELDEQPDGSVIVTMPQWLAEEKELV